MRLTRTITTALAAVVVSGLLVAGALAASTNGTADHDMGQMTMTKARRRPPPTCASRSTTCSPSTPFSR